MPSIVWSDRSKIYALRAMEMYMPGLIVRLFVNNVTPVGATVLADLTEASYPGYSEIPWVPGAATIVTGDRASWSPASFIFGPPTSGGDVDVYGFMVMYLEQGSGTERLMQAARFTGAPVTLTVGGPGVFFTITDKAYDVNNP